MMNTDKAICRRIAVLLAAYGIRDVVLCPGNRNAPLIMAVSRNRQLTRHVVVDERSAAFIALGMSIQSDRPVAVICTSGSALMNLAPAAAEAYYRGVPLILISADRPAAHIDISEPQTMRQPGALANMVKYSTDLPADSSNYDNLQWANRLINDVLHMAVTGPKGPVHINVHIHEPLTNEIETSDGDCDMSGKFLYTMPQPTLSVAEARALGQMLAPPCKVLVVAGFMSPHSRINRAMQKLASLPNVAVLAEAQSNIHADRVHGNIDGLLTLMSHDMSREMTPDVVITAGGATASHSLGKWLRSLPGLRHWSISQSITAPDLFGHLERRIMMSPEIFLPQLASAMTPLRSCESSYNDSWNTLAGRLQDKTDAYLKNVRWSALKAMDMVVAMAPPHCNVHVSNGMSVRLLQITGYKHLHRVECNRGISGIDGCTSTALGAALSTDNPTWLLTGDMSAQYDIAALAFHSIPDNFKMVVFSNRGGNIFRIIPSTRHLPELEECFAADIRLPLDTLAKAYNLEYFEADDEDELARTGKDFRTCRKAAILNIILDEEADIKAYKNYFSHLRT